MSSGDTTVSHSPPWSLFSIPLSCFLPLSFPKYPINYPHRYPFFPSYSAISKWSTGRLPILAESTRERKTDVGHNSRRNYHREPSEQNEKAKGKLGVEICEGKHLERELKKWDTWKWRWGLCVNSQFSSFFPLLCIYMFVTGHSVWHSRIPQYLILGRCNTATIYPHCFLPTKENTFPLLSPFRPAQYEAERERWQQERERYREGGNILH